MGGTSDDNRIRLDETPVDFTRTDNTGELHDEYPSPNTQGRYDFMRSFLIGLLSHQSSPGDCEPFEKRIGTTWFNKTLAALMLWDGVSFKALANFIGVDTTDEEGTEGITTLQSMLNDINGALAYVGPRVIWSGIFNTDEVDSIPIPEEFWPYSELSGMRALVYIEGLLIDPRKTVIDPQTPSQINLIGVDAVKLQTFTVKLEKVTDLKDETVPAEG